MHIGISLMYWPWFEPAEQLQLAVQADLAGLHAVWVAEGYGQEAAAMLGLLAGRTRLILLGAGILQIPARQPATAAMVASTVDRLSGGRMLLGLGLSGPQVSEGCYGVPFTAPLRRTREYVEIIRLALSGQRVTYDGAEWTLPVRGSGLGLGQPLKLIAAPDRGSIPVYLGVAARRPSSRPASSPMSGPRSCSAPSTAACSPRHCCAASNAPAARTPTSPWPRWSPARSTTTSTAPATRSARCSPCTSAAWGPRARTSTSTWPTATATARPREPVGTPTWPATSAAPPARSPTNCATWSPSSPRSANGSPNTTRRAWTCWSSRPLVTAPPWSPRSPSTTAPPLSPARSPGGFDARRRDRRSRHDRLRQAHQHPLHHPRDRRSATGVRRRRLHRR